ncbi:MAG: carbon-nitrogen hydrolase family protein [Bacteriovoracaceae bacterium]
MKSVINLLLTISLFSSSVSSFAATKTCEPTKPIPAPVKEPMKPIKEVVEPEGNFPKEQFLKIAVISSKQKRGVTVTDKAQVQKYKEDNIKELESYIRKASDNKANFIMAPEYAIAGYPNNDTYEYKTKDDAKYMVESVPGATTEFFSRLAVELQVYLSINMLENDAATGKFYNSQVVIDPSGKIIAKHRKYNLYQTESQFLTSGDENGTIVNTPWGRVGFLICADTYQILLLHKYLGKVDHLFVSASWTQNNAWKYFTATAALTKTNYVVSNQHFNPDSGVINADGTEQSHIRQTEGIAYGYLKYKNRR